MKEKAQNNLLEVECARFNEYKLNYLGLEKSPGLKISIVLGERASSYKGPDNVRTTEVLCDFYDMLNHECKLERSQECIYNSLIKSSLK
jgi:hypothetical protein